jgi:hypothetical protein
MKMKIAVMGTHGLGKTKLVDMLEVHCKNLGETYVPIRTWDYRELIKARDPVNDAHGEITKRIFFEIYPITNYPHENYEIVYGTAIDPVIYLIAMELKGGCPAELHRYATNWMHTYDLIFYVIPSAGVIPVNKKLTLDEKFQDKVADEFSLYMNEFMFQLDVNIIQLESDDIHNKRIKSIFKNVIEDEND